VLADESLLNLRDAVWIDGLLAARAARFVPGVRKLVGGGAGVAARGRVAHIRSERGRHKKSRGDQKRQRSTR
jgi:hypothetical protein